MSFKIKIRREDITYGPQEPDEVTAWVVAGDLMKQGYRKTSNAYCLVSRIDRDDWLDVLAKQRRCSRADFYNVDGSGIGNQHRDHYVRTFSKDKLTVAPEVHNESVLLICIRQITDRHAASKLHWRRWLGTNTQMTK